MSSVFLHSPDPKLTNLLEGLFISYGTVTPSEGAYDAIIHWKGNFADSENLNGYPGFILNRPEMLVKVQDKSYVRQTFVRNGLLLDSSQRAGKMDTFVGSKYIVPVFHLRAIALYVCETKGLLLSSQSNLKSVYRGIGLEDVSKTVKKIISDAIRAVYCLGLDFGIVKIRLNASGQTISVDVNPQPKLTKPLAQLFAKAIHDFDMEIRTELTNKQQVMMGMDPEFILRGTDGKVVPASKFLKRKGQVGSDAIHIGNRRVIYPLVELRPEPSPDPRQLVTNLINTMHMAAGKITDTSLKWNAGGMPVKGFPLGGHLHLSNIWLNSELLRVLDNYLALPLTLIEDSTTRLRRPGFGALGDFRRQPHGGFEYRTLPSWLVSPRITKGVIALTLVIAEHYRQLRRRPLEDERVLAAYFNIEKVEPEEQTDPLRKNDFLVNVINIIWVDLEKLSAYKHYIHYLEPLRKQMTEQQRWDEQRDFRRVWKIKPYTDEIKNKPTFRDIIERV
ncbi:MAG TPA: hypothetical protein VGE40_10030 [Bacilli bacterium]